MLKIMLKCYQHVKYCIIKYTDLLHTNNSLYLINISIAWFRISFSLQILYLPTVGIIWFNIRLQTIKNKQYNDYIMLKTGRDFKPAFTRVTSIQTVPVNGTICIVPPTGRLRAHHKAMISLYFGVHRLTGTNIFSWWRNEVVDRSSFSSVGSLFNARGVVTEKALLPIHRCVRMPDDEASSANRAGTLTTVIV